MLGARREGGVAELGRSIGAVQAQDGMGEVLAVRVRSDHLTAADVHRERVESRSVVRTWLMRGTLHLVPSADIRWLLDLLGMQMDRKAHKRRANLGVTPDIYTDAMTLIGRELAGEALTRAQIIERFREAGLPWEGQVVPHLLRSASLTGLICFGPLADGDDTHVLLDEWLPERTADPPNPAAELARRFFGAYGPATPSDFRSWTGLAAADARAGFDAIGDELVELSVDGRSMRMLADAAERVDEVLAQPTPVVRMLGPFDPYLLGYAKRELGVSADLVRRVHPGGGMILPTILSDGVMIGTWTRRRTSRGVKISVTAVDDLSVDERAGIEAEVAAIGRFLGVDVSWQLEVR